MRRRSTRIDPAAGVGSSDASNAAGKAPTVILPSRSEAEAVVTPKTAKLPAPRVTAAVMEVTEPYPSRFVASFSYPFTYKDNEAYSNFRKALSGSGLLNPFRGLGIGGTMYNVWQPGNELNANPDMEFKEVASFKRLSRFEIGTTSVQLPMTIYDELNNQYALSDVVVKLFSRNVGLLQFSVSLKEQPKEGRLVTLNDVIVLMNSIRRLTTANDLHCKGATGDRFEFNSVHLIDGILCKELGEKSVIWTADALTDRLFSYITVECIIPPAMNNYETRLKLAYHLGTVTRLQTKVDQDFLTEYVGQHGYARFHTKEEGGAHLCFSYNGGAAVIMASADSSLDYAKQFKGTERYTKTLIEPLLFQRTYLQSLAERLSTLMVRQKGFACLQELTSIHGHVLEFKARFGHRQVFNTRSMREQFIIWSATVGTEEMKDHLGDSIGELHSYYSDITGRETQSRLDMLAVVLGFLGMAELIINIVTADDSFTPQIHDVARIEIHSNIRRSAIQMNSLTSSNLVRDGHRLVLTSSDSCHPFD